MDPGWLVDLALGVLAVEALILLVYRARTGRGIPALSLLPNLGAGASLMLGLRSALHGSGTIWVGVWLICALICHVGDLALRWTAAAGGGVARS